jgi:signal transduction histidine kinase
VTVSPGGVLTIENSGTQLDPGDVGRLAEPFARADGSHREPGHGLGLAIVDAIAAAHGVTVQRRARADGGLRTWVALGADPASVAPGLPDV